MYLFPHFNSDEDLLAFVSEVLYPVSQNDLDSYRDWKYLRPIPPRRSISMMTFAQTEAFRARHFAYQDQLTKAMEALARIDRIGLGELSYANMDNLDTYKQMVARHKEALGTNLEHQIWAPGIIADFVRCQLNWLPQSTSLIRFLSWK